MINRTLIAPAALMLLAHATALAQFYPQPQPAGQAATGGDATTVREGLSDHARQMFEDAELCDVAFVDAQRGWAVGERGVIWHTADAGRTWQLQTSGVDCRLSSVQFIDAQTGWAVGGYVYPYTHRTTGVVLRTRDGGKRWTRAPDAALPLLRRVKFVSAASGWLIGEPSALYPSGVFFSRDAGKSWQPVPGEAPGRWLCGDFRDDQAGAIAGCDGALRVATAKGFAASRAPKVGLRAVRDVRFEARGGGVLVGDGGVVMTTADAGQSWQPPRGGLPAATRREFDFRAAAIVGQRMWIAGSPGTQVLHTPDGGETWQMLPTGQSLPLFAMTFHDAQHGWAVGAMGTILATRDGGRTWLRQHSGGTRAALLVVLADGEDLPLELVARLGGDEGYLTVAEVLGRRDVDAPRDYAASASDRARGAMSAVGGSGLYQAWAFPLRERELPLAPPRIVATWDELHDGAGVRALEEQLVRRIRQWQPEVIVAPSAARAEDRLLQRATLAAVAAAADEHAYPEQISAAKLPAWKVRKVFTVAAAGEADDVTLSSARLAVRSEGSLAEIAARAQGYLAEDLAVRPATSGFRLRAHDVMAAAARRDIFAGLSLSAGGEARRRLSDPPAATTDFVREQAQRGRHLQRMLAASDAGSISDAAWLAQIETLTSKLQRDGASRAIYQLAQRYGQTGRVTLAADALQMLGERYADTPESEAAMRKLFLDYVSAEQSCWQSAHTASEVRPATAIGSVSGDTINDDDARGAGNIIATTGVSAVEKSQVQRSGRAIAVQKTIERTRPTLAAEPALQLALAAAQRLTGDQRAADAIYRRLAAGDERHAWVGCARAELWLTQPRGNCPRPLVRCKLGRERPYLDGRLDDAVWQTSSPLTLASRYGDDRTWPAVAMLACDGEFLYVAATCRSVVGGDADGVPSAHERVELLIDVNRDWNSHFTLAVDQQGVTTAACDGAAAWTPKWYVARSADEAAWTIEGAIPLASLGVDAKQGDAWAIGLQRVAPGAGIQAWSQPASVKGETQGLGVLLFE